MSQFCNFLFKHSIKKIGTDIKYNLNKSWLAQVPEMGTSGSAGYDLFLADDKILKVSSVTTITTHLYLEIPPGYFGRIFQRSSHAHYHFLDAGGGVIDSDFRGEVIIIMFNYSKEDYEVAIDDRIVQIVFQKKRRGELCEV